MVLLDVEGWQPGKNGGCQTRRRRFRGQIRVGLGRARPEWDRVETVGDKIKRALTESEAREGPDGDFVQKRWLSGGGPASCKASRARGEHRERDSEGRDQRRRGETGAVIVRETEHSQRWAGGRELQRAEWAVVGVGDGTGEREAREAKVSFGCNCAGLPVRQGGEMGAIGRATVNPDIRTSWQQYIDLILNIRILSRLPGCPGAQCCCCSLLASLFRLLLYLWDRSEQQPTNSLPPGIFPSLENRDDFWSLLAVGFIVFCSS